MYKIGDKVRIKSRAWFDAQPKDRDGDVWRLGEPVFSRRMTRYCGCIAEIVALRHRHCDTQYRLAVDGAVLDYAWTDNMIETLGEYDRYDRLREEVSKLRERLKLQPKAMVGGRCFEFIDDLEKDDKIDLAGHNSLTIKNLNV